MREAVAAGISDSARDFLEKVWPVVRPWFQGGELIPVEAVSPGRFASELDVLAGIDAWHVDSARGVRGIASRVQWGDKIWDSFTIRRALPSGRPTEFEKRLDALDNPDAGWLFPHVTVQAYVSERGPAGRLVSAGAVKTRDLFEHVVRNGPSVSRKNNSDGVEFMAVYWNDLINCGVKSVRTYRCPSAAA